VIYHEIILHFVTKQNSELVTMFVKSNQLPSRRRTSQMALVTPI